METRKEIDEVSEFTFAFRMIGDRMNNGSKWSFANGDYLRCDEVNIQDVKIGNDYVIKIGSGYTVRRISSINDRHITIFPLNPLYEESQISIDDIQQMFIVNSCQTKAIQEFNAYQFKLQEVGKKSVSFCLIK